MKHFFTFIILTFMVALTASAQANIDRAVEKIEKKKTTQYVAYSENRDPKTHKVSKASKVLVIDDSSARQLKDAFERDREKSVSFEMVQGRTMEIKFSESGKSSCYTLVQQRNGSWLLTVEIRNIVNVKRHRRTCDPSENSDIVSDDYYIVL